MLEEEKVNELLKAFHLLPKVKKKKSFLEICKYPGSRVEEVCSRILGFYFSPKEEHGFKDLFLQSFFELIEEENIRFYEDQVRVVLEKYTEKGKKIDVFIYSPDFVIGIENKITAKLYNSLDEYGQLIEKHDRNNRNKKKFKIVLSVFKITNEEELKKIGDNGFTAITYSDFFKILKKNIGQYATGCNQKYLSNLLDFIKFIENMTNNNEQLGRRTLEFYFEKREEIESLKHSYEKYQAQVRKIQIDKIAEIKAKISSLTKSDWWAWQGWDLGFNSFSENHKIGIESSFEETRGNPLGEFKIYITTWNLKDWYPFKEEIIKKYPQPSYFLDVDEGIKNRVFLHVDVINGCDENKIAERLQEHFNNLKRIIKNKLASED